ncbi:MAG: stage III sporulation protein AF [Firmicutes bacterium]|nr:stage III sporulation protein AF [Bacillota bacterium]
MMETIGGLIRYIVILIFISTLLEMILPQGVFRRYLRMLIGILLIFTLITPLQKITRLAPYWEIPPLVNSMENESAAELEAILGHGERLYKEKMKDALKDYQAKVSDLLTAELAREFKQDLLDLQITTEDNPDSKEFGLFKDVYAVVQEQKPVKKVTAPGNVEEINVAVEVISPNKGAFRENSGSGKTENSSASPESNGGKIKEIEKYLAAYFRLSPENVKVEIRP